MQPRFLSTPSARRATDDKTNKIRYISVISIHALREEGDKSSGYTGMLNRVFLSTPSARRATAWASSSTARYCNFYPRPPRGGRQLRAAAGGL